MMRSRGSIIVSFLLFSGALSCANYHSDFRNIFLNVPHIAGLILARGGSKSIPLKNLQTVEGVSLLGRTLQKAKRVRFDSLWVSTDHPLIIQEAEKFDVNVHWRAPETASDEASSLLATKEFLNKHPTVNVVALLQCTSPFLKQIYLETAVNLIFKFDCVFSVTRFSKLVWVKSQDNVYPVNFDPKNRPRRQELGSQFIENGMFYFAKKELIDEGSFQSNR